MNIVSSPGPVPKRSLNSFAAGATPRIGLPKRRLGILMEDSDMRKPRGISTGSDLRNKKIVDLTEDSDTESANQTLTGKVTDDAADEMDLLDGSSLGFNNDHQLYTAPILTRDAYLAVGHEKTIRQYGVFGSILEIGSKESKETPTDRRLYLNTNAPFSAVVCGVQGSGKSHTVSVMLENMLVPKCSSIGSLAQPLAGLVLHFGEGGRNAHPCEAAYVGLPKIRGIKAPKVSVYVPRSSLKTMTRIYATLGTNITVQPLSFSEEELDAEAFLTMMAVGSLESAPLYMQIVMSILRELGENFTHSAFHLQLEKKKRDFNPAQLSCLEQRMVLLDSFLSKTKQSRFAAGQLTIIDLSDPFIDAGSACSLFEIVVRLFIRADVGTGKVLLVDEAHKYLSVGDGSTGLTKSLLTLIREQRHLAMRVILSTQEPTVIPPVILDLCTIMVLHRFSSPQWWEHIIRHVSAEISSGDAFDKVVHLQTGEAIILSPSGLTMLNNGKTLGQLGRLYLIVKSRKRVTRDGGTSVLVLNSNTAT